MMRKSDQLLDGYQSMLKRE